MSLLIAIRRNMFVGNRTNFLFTAILTGSYFLLINGELYSTKTLSDTLDRCPLLRSKNLPVDFKFNFNESFIVNVSFFPKRMVEIDDIKKT